MNACHSLPLLAAGYFLLSTSARAQLLEQVIHDRVTPLPGAKTWGKAGTKDVLLSLHYHSRVKPSQLLIGRDHPNGTRFLALFPGVGVPLPLKFDRNFDGFDGFGDLKPGYYVQVAEHDFDGDGVPEIVIAVGNGSIDLAINVVRYHAPASARDAGRTANWTPVGSFSGQSKVSITAGTIELPYGSQGLYTAYKFVKGRFRETP